MQKGNARTARATRQERFLQGSSFTAEAIANGDWTETALGPIERWPQPLKTALGMLLHSDAPKLLVWGSELLTFYNDAYAEGMGKLRGEGIGRPFPEFRPQAWQIARKYFEGALAGEGVTVRDLAVPTKRQGTDTTVYLTISTVPVIDEQGSVGGVLCEVSERTGQLQMENQLRRDNDRLKRLFEAAPVFLALGSVAEYRFEYANRAYEELIGNRDVEGKVVWEVLPEAEAQGFVDLLRMVERTGKPFQGRDVPYRRICNGVADERFIDFVYQPIKDQSGKVTHIVCVGHDVTEEHEARARAQVLKNQLDQAARLNAMGTMAATLAHELNQPLTAASNYLAGCQRLAAGYEGADILQQGLQETTVQISRAAEIIRRARSLLSGGEPKRSAVSLSDLTDRTLKSLRGDPACDDAIFKVDIATEADLVCVDAVQLEQVLANLVRNACQAAGPGAKVEIRGARKQDHTLVTISDNGPGFDPSLGSVFENFGKSAGGGLGLGLAITRTIIEAHGSKVQTRNGEDGGAVVEFALPLVTSKGN